VHELPAAARLCSVQIGAEEEEDRSATGSPGAAVDLVAGGGQDQEECTVSARATPASPLSAEDHVKGAVAEATRLWGLVLKTKV